MSSRSREPNAQTGSYAARPKRSILDELVSMPRTPHVTRIALRFWCCVEALGHTRTKGLRVVRNELEHAAVAQVVATLVGKTDALETTLVLRSIGKVTRPSAECRRTRHEAWSAPTRRALPTPSPVCSMTPPLAGWQGPAGGPTTVGAALTPSNGAPDRWLGGPA